MSAMAFAPHDIAGLSASTGRKLAAASTPDAEAQEDFSAALVQIADSAPAQAAGAASRAGAVQQAAPPPALAAGASAKGDIWREFSAFSGAATGAEAKAEAVLGRTSAAGEAKFCARSGAAEKTSPPAIARETVSNEDGAAAPDISPRNSSARTVAGATDLPATRGTITSKFEDTAKPSERIQAKSAEEEPKLENTRPAPAASSALSTPPTPPAPPLTTTAAAPLVPAPAAPSPQTTGSADENKEDMRDAVARIGAALAEIGAATGGRTAADADEKPDPQASPEGAPVSAHVVSQKTWLPPVRATPSLDLRSLSQDAAAQAPRALAGKFAEAGAKAAPAGDTRDAPVTTPPADARSDAPLGLATAPPASSLATPGDDDGAKPAAAAATAAPASAAAPAPRRDLEITLAPKELGGLEVRMKSAGDRLELAFVTERGETARMISDKSGALESQLHGAGLGLGGIDISAAATGQGGGGPAPGGGRETQPQPQAAGGGDPDQPPQSQTPSGRDRQERKDDAHDPTADPRPRGDRGLYL